MASYSYTAWNSYGLRCQPIQIKKNIGKRPQTVCGGCGHTVWGTTVVTWNYARLNANWKMIEATKNTKLLKELRSVPKGISWQNGNSIVLIVHLDRLISFSSLQLQSPSASPSFSSCVFFIIVSMIKNYTKTWTPSPSSSQSSSQSHVSASNKYPCVKEKTKVWKMSTPKITKKSFKIKRYNNYCITIVIIKKCYIYIG